MATILGQRAVQNTRGRFLDVGCGNGSLLRAFVRLHPEWSLAGTELDPRHQREVEALCGQGRFFTGDLAHVEGSFDIIAVVHLMEHLTEPAALLKTILGKLAKGGRVLIQVPLWQENPFDLLVTDHCLHFNQECLVETMRLAGLQPIFISREVVPRELTVIAAHTPGRTPMPGTNPPDSSNELFEKETACNSSNSFPPPAFSTLEQAVSWLVQVRDMAMSAMANSR
ncbi:MAG: class I SAM-dependent methyltransferase, partial [Planctomycetes bacterium]|nr:class I SAM-dependent methyltransferase [Planctomycetota bacterium]